MPELANGTPEERLITLGTEIEKLIPEKAVDKIEEKYDEMSQNPELTQDELNTFNACVEKIEAPNEPQSNEEPTGVSDEVLTTHSQNDEIAEDVDETNIQVENTVADLTEETQQQEQQMNEEIEEQIRQAVEMNM